MSVTDLMRAARYGDLKGVKRNLNQVGKQDRYGRTALMYAAINGHAYCIPLLEKEIGMQNKGGWTALMWAASNDHTDSVRLLFSEAGKQSTEERKFDLNGITTFPPGTTALMLAAHYNRPEVVELLLPYEQGLKDSKGHTAQWHANNGASWRGDFTRVRELLKNEGPKRVPPPPKESVFLRTFATVGDIEGVRKYVSHAGYQDSNGMTALMLTAEKGYVDCIPLLENEVGMQNNWGWTALMKAVFYDHTDCARLLLSEAGKQSAKEWNFTSNGETVAYPSGTTALMIAAIRNHPDIVEILLPYEQGMKDSEGHTAQWHANNKGYSAQVRKLLKKEGTKRLPPSLNSEVLELRECVNELAVENESLKRGLSSLKNAQEEADDEPSQMSQKVSSLEERLEKCQEMNRSLRRTLNQKTEEAKAITTCVICLTNPKDTLLQPCGHLCACSNCAEQIMNQTCPFCRTPVERVIKAYI